MSKRTRNKPKVKVLTLGPPYYCDDDEAARLVRNSEADIVATHPPVLRLILTPIFNEELRYLSGYLVNADPDRELRKLPAHVLKQLGVKATITKAGNSWRKSARKIRTRRPRGITSPDWVVLRRLMAEDPVKHGV